MLHSRLRLLRRREGQVMAEYAVILGVITIAVVGTFVALGGGVASALQNVVSAF